MSEAPPAYGAPPPAAGLRIPLTTVSAFPSPDLVGAAPFHDLDGSGVWVASALMENQSVHPAKVVRDGRVMVSYGGAEIAHQGRYDVLPITNQMEWVPAAHGQVPKGRRVVEGGFEEDGNHLHHAVTTIQGVQVPGKAGAHLKGANFPFGGGEHVVQDGYQLLCWR
ncbi:BZ3500_MvSof-1268-A1-R1_Chr8-2g10272 [Microbotryum saponariae]|uniref:BZ3500_MvSof-1268-A1-R1_Chr8-2g10272 protein n=1 Tax=Microbotryum saponariae TaxID=289078 RepID=A0A2X0LK71_9BASI|nr:BZ3500_MvSof-1268-A1-R1_Chr8-2g10272 [Microbotryum saponariae]SDA02070.1 BZ3501_MvSof-1269-A2-R1_Chr8-2g10022 [Microbotryum saponariae]